MNDMCVNIWALVFQIDKRIPSFVLKEHLQFNTYRMKTENRVELKGFTTVSNYAHYVTKIRSQLSVNHNLIATSHHIDLYNHA